MFKSTQINHWVPNWVSYFLQDDFLLQDDRVPFSDGSQLLQLWIKTHFKHIFDLSIKSPWSLERYEV